MGEGGVMFALESDSVARQRSAKVYGELAGFGGSSDAFHLVIPNENPETAATALRTAMDEAQVNPSDIDYLNAHGTSTPVGDRAEARILHLVFGAEVHRIPVSSTKSMTGHLLSAAAAFEALACLIAIDRQTLPPTINLDNPDPECDLNHVANQAQAHPVSITMSNSFGFGGSNNSIIIRKVA
jgi:3-oxoacyl-[acyl-carrier-protein] synthase II